MVCEMLGKFPYEVEAIPYREFERLAGYVGRNARKAAAFIQNEVKQPKGRAPKRKPRVR